MCCKSVNTDVVCTLLSNNQQRGFKNGNAVLKIALHLCVSCIAVSVCGVFPALQFLAPYLAETPELPLSSRSFPGRGSKASELAHQLLSRRASQLISHPGKPCPPPVFENNLPISQPACKSVSQIILIVTSDSHVKIPTPENANRIPMAETSSQHSEADQLTKTKD